MGEPAAGSNSDSLVARVRKLIADRVAALPLPGLNPAAISQLLPGKMLRTRLAARLAAGETRAADPQTLPIVCAATEMAHTASLCHDDVIDGGLIRRRQPALWRTTSPSGAVLIGDLLLCEAMDLLLDTEGGRHVAPFVAKIREVCAAEAEQELLFRGQQPEVETCLRLARGKTGALFAFVAGVCGGDDEPLASALEEAGYKLGTAYQLADDLLDVIGSEELTGKTLGTDARREKRTLAQIPEGGHRVVRRYVSDLCHGALDGLAPWPRACAALGEFHLHDLLPAVNRGEGNGTQEVRLAV